MGVFVKISHSESCKNHFKDIEIDSKEFLPSIVDFIPKKPLSMKQVPINITAINLHCQTYGLSMILDKKNWNFTESHLKQLQKFFFRIN